MVRAQIGNEIGVAAVDKADESALAAITADGANTITVSVADARQIPVGIVVDLVNKTTGAVLASARTITAKDATTGVLTYSGADVAAVPGTTQVYVTGGYEAAVPTQPLSAPREDYVNLNGGPSPGSGFDNTIFGSIDAMRARLTAISATTYSSAELDKMTLNDMIYAIRVNDMPGSIK